jgi:hypothetical protein
MIINGINKKITALLKDGITVIGIRVDRSVRVPVWGAIDKSG